MASMRSGLQRSKKMKIEIPDDVIDEIVKDELKKAYLLNIIPDKYDLSDDEIDVNIEFINALYTVMEYFIPEDELYPWISAERYGQKEKEVEVPCKTHPDAPHGFLRQASHAEGRYVCECEHWEPEE